MARTHRHDGNGKRVRSTSGIGACSVLPRPALPRFAAPYRFTCLRNYAFDSVVGSMYESVGANLRQSKTLAAIRDALLPQLLSGEVRVKAAAKAVEEVA